MNFITENKDIIEAKRINTEKVLTEIKDSIITNKPIKIYHLSHIDLDGYGSQLITNLIFSKFPNFIENVSFYNSNYGNELNENLGKIFTQINKEIEENKAKDYKYYLVITDLNLTPVMCSSINTFINKKKEGQFNVVLLDHHLVDKELVESNLWYNVNTSVCATKFTSNRFLNIFSKEIGEDLTDFLDKLSSFVNISDLWNKTHPDFTKALFLSDIVFTETRNLPFIEELDNENRNYKFSLIESIFKLISEGKTIEDIESSLVSIKKKYLTATNTIEPEFLNNPEISLRLKFHRYTYLATKDKISEIYKTEKGLLYKIFFNFMESDTYVANFYLEDAQIGKVPYVDFIILIGAKGKMSLRSIGDVNVKDIAMSYFNGGGHKNASGGYINLGIVKDKKNILRLVQEVLLGIRTAKGEDSESN